MTELERNAEGLIKPPAHLAQEQQQKSDRSAILDELKRWLSQEHEKALAEIPYRSFKSKLPLDTLKNLTDQERDEIAIFEEQAFSRHQGLARTKGEKKRAWIAAGGDEDAFENHWEIWGKDEHLGRKADEIEERARRSSSIY